MASSYTHVTLSVFFFGIQVVAGLTVVTDLEHGMIRQIVPVSYKHCKDECDSSMTCTSVKYFRNFKVCKLYDIDVLCGSECEVYSKPHELRATDASMYENCNTETTDVTTLCEPVSCPNPMVTFNQYSAERVHGNSLIIGAVIKYRCMDSDYSGTITCSIGGTWSPVLCKCIFSLGFQFEAVWSNATHATAKRKCPSGTNLIETIRPTCEFETGIWRNEPTSCCEAVGSEWVLVYRLLDGFNIPVISSWTDPSRLDPLLEKSHLLDEWDALGVTTVKVEVIKDGHAAVTMEFNGCGTNNKNWFSLDRLVVTRSTWDFVGWNSPIKVFSIAGFNIYRFLISEYRTDDAGCNQGNMWFTITKMDQNNCSYPSHHGSILFAPGVHAVLFKHMMRADSVSISIKHL